MIADSVKVSVFGKISDKLYSAQITSVSGRCKSAYVISHKPLPNLTALTASVR